MKLLILRHFESEANVNQIIQGPDINLALSKKGRKDAVKFTLEHKELSSICHLFVSPSKRTKETAKIITKQYPKKIITQPLLQEIHPGIVQGPKKVVQKKYPQYLKIWEERKDIDMIPEAETGDEIQSRVLCFLEQFMNDQSKQIYLIITHAGFIRCMINTIRNRDRTSPVNINFEFIHSIENPWKNIILQKNKNAKSSNVYEIKTINQTYILKKNNKRKEDIVLFSQIISSHQLFEKILSFNEQCLVRVKYPGTTCYQISKSVEKKIIKYVYQLQQHCIDNSQILKKMRALDLSTLLEQKMRHIPKDLQQICSRVISEVTTSQTILVDYDLHRGNFLYHDHKVRKIDIDSYCYADPQFYPASLLQSFFLLENIKYPVSEFRNIWPETIEINTLKPYLLARAFIGLSFFAKMENRNSENEDLYQKYYTNIKYIEKMY